MGNGDNVVDAEFVEVKDEQTGKTTKVPLKEALRRSGIFKDLADDLEQIENTVHTLADLAEQAKEHVPRMVQSARRVVDRLGGLGTNDRKPMKR